MNKMDIFQTPGSLAKLSVAMFLPMKLPWMMN